ncbi:hypothetical protein CV102_09545 [Natronococcus pandeyae]|uniref:Tetrapyrrole biosynthesis glutamyl-tRNA reductase dimerisation domain-containing protein n=1 Tax=Natronococcus pandeyae TaxID=2055836 RepID=A0A8J8TSN6_9EURY|nr:hypothetical protein [Natronococcus pandeyae]TYL38752.1 hypothetical protein CV102_09545 [Natronococcus pandeyae]
MTIPIERLECEPSGSQATTPRDGRDGRCDSMCADCRRALALERLRRFAAETRRAAVDRARRELGDDGELSAEQERIVEAVATRITGRLLVEPAAALCRDDDVDAETVAAMLELFELDTAASSASKEPEAEQGEQTNDGPSSRCDSPRANS